LNVFAAPTTPAVASIVTSHCVAESAWPDSHIPPAVVNSTSIDRRGLVS
jgi:hypothetical protein